MSSDKFQKLKIKEYSFWELYLHPQQYYLGRTYIWAKRSDALDLMDMQPQEQEELFDIARQVNKALSELFHPDLMNYAALGNVANHLHLHIIPRYSSSRRYDEIEFVDEQWGKNYAPYETSFQVPPSTLMKIKNAISLKL
ncbi:MAG: HIT domain-containing protein [Nanoarchaeota archaeon]|nr:HIT domain-containing protein [Nanoarchaeota archaeon]